MAQNPGIVRVCIHTGRTAAEQFAFSQYLLVDFDTTFESQIFPVCIVELFAVYAGELVLLYIFDQ